MIQRAKARRKTEGFRKREGFVWPEAYPDLAAVQRNPSCPLGTRERGSPTGGSQAVHWGGSDLRSEEV